MMLLPMLLHSPTHALNYEKPAFGFYLSLSLSRLRLSVRGAVSTGGSGVGLRQWWCRCHSLLLLSRLEPNKNWSTTSVGDIRISLVLVVVVTPLVIGFARSTRERECPSSLMPALLLALGISTIAVEVVVIVAVALLVFICSDDDSGKKRSLCFAHSLARPIASSSQEVDRRQLRNALRISGRCRVLIRLYVYSYIKTKH